MRSGAESFYALQFCRLYNIYVKILLSLTFLYIKERSRVHTSDIEESFAIPFFSSQNRLWPQLVFLQQPCPHRSLQNLQILSNAL